MKVFLALWAAIGATRAELSLALWEPGAAAGTLDQGFYRISWLWVILGEAWVDAEPVPQVLDEMVRSHGQYDKNQ
jgi:hypothetical protein